MYRRPISNGDVTFVSLATLRVSRCDVFFFLSPRAECHVKYFVRPRFHQSGLSSVPSMVAFAERRRMGITGSVAQTDGRTDVGTT